MIAPGATTAPVTLRHLDRRRRRVHGPHRGRRRRQRAAGQAGQQHQHRPAVRRARRATCRTTCTRPRTRVIGGGAAVVGPNRTIGDLAGEASGRRAVTLDTTGAYVEFTTKAPTNTLVTRFSIPDAPGGGGIDATLNVYVNGTFHKALDLTSKYAWLYGDEASPEQLARPPARRGTSTTRRNLMLDTTVPAGSRIRLQKDPANTTTYAIDFINLEQAAPIANPDPARYAVPAGFTHQDVQNALDRARHGHHDSTGVYLPPGDYQHVQQVPGVRQGRQGRRRRAVVHPVPRAGRPGEHRRRLPGRRDGERLDVRELRLLRQLHVAHRRPGQGVRLRERVATSRSTTSGSSTWSASTGAPTPTT